MNFKIKYNTNGSALIFTILTLFILSVLGTALISVAMNNFTMTNHSNAYNTTYYLADGAAEEVIIKFSILVQNAEIEALKALSNDDVLIFKNYDSDHYSENQAKEDFISNISDEFEEGFSDYLDENFDEKIIDMQSFDPKFDNGFDSEDSLKIELITPDEADELGSDSTVVINVTGNYHDMTRKLNLVFTIPKYKFSANSRFVDAEEDSFYVVSFNYEEGCKKETEFKWTWKEINIS